MSKFEIKGLTFTTPGQTTRFINQLREIGDQLKGSIFTVPMGVNLPAGNKVGRETEDGAAINKITTNLT